MRTNGYSLDAYVEDLRRITRATTDEGKILAQVEPLAQRLALDKAWLQKKHYETNPEQGFGTFLLHEEPDHSLAVLVVNWMPGRGAPPHDHGTWAVVSGVEGLEKNVSYRRMDDRTRTDYAELEVKKETIAGPGDLVCMRTGGIHSVHNETGNISISLHTYGKHINHTDRAQFDLDTNEMKDFIVRVN